MLRLLAQLVLASMLWALTLMTGLKAAGIGTAMERSRAAASAADIEAARDESQAVLEAATALGQNEAFLREQQRQLGEALTAAGNCPLSGEVSAEGLQSILGQPYSPVDAAELWTRLDGAPAPRAPTPNRDVVPPVWVFVSFSMPEESLRLLAQSAAETNAVLVLRGLHGNALKATLVRLRELLGDNPQAAEPALVLDPTLFRRFNVDKVPTFVVALGPVERCTDSDCAVPGHLKVAGDVSLAYALQVMAGRAKAPAMRDHIQRTRDRLQWGNRS